MIELDLSLSYEECKEEVKNWTEGDLENYLMDYKENLPPLKRALVNCGFSGEPSTAEAVSDELLKRRYGIQNFQNEK